MTEAKREIVLQLDELDYAAIQKAIAYRQTWGRGTMPDSDSNVAGAVLAEICRGWLEKKGMWP